MTTGKHFQYWQANSEQGQIIRTTTRAAAVNTVRLANLGPPTPTAPPPSGTRPTGADASLRPPTVRLYQREPNTAGITMAKRGQLVAALPRFSFLGAAVGLADRQQWYGRLDS